MEFEVEITVRHYDGVGADGFPNEERVYHSKNSLTAAKSWYSLFNKEATQAFEHAEDYEEEFKNKCWHDVILTDADGDATCDRCGYTWSRPEEHDIKVESELT